MGRLEIDENEASLMPQKPQATNQKTLIIGKFLQSVMEKRKWGHILRQTGTP
mgnify:FL=1